MDASQASWREIRVSLFCLRRGCEGVDEVALAYYGQLLENAADIDQARSTAPRIPGECRSAIHSRIPANRLRIGQKLARKILADYMLVGVVQTVAMRLRASLARNSREFILFAERMRGEDARGSMKSPSRIYGQLSGIPRGHTTPRQSSRPRCPVVSLVAGRSLFPCESVASVRITDYR